VVGCGIAAYLNNLLGRRKALVVTAIVSLIGVIIEVTSAVGPSARFAQFVVGKTIASVAMGLVVNIVPVYLSETAPAELRGFGISLYQVSYRAVRSGRCGSVRVLALSACKGVLYLVMSACPRVAASKRA
jgi:MFS family permease